MRDGPTSKQYLFLSPPLPHMSLQGILYAAFCFLTETCQMKPSSEFPFEMSIQHLKFQLRYFHIGGMFDL